MQYDSIINIYFTTFIFKIMTEIINKTDAFGTLTINTTASGALLAIEDALANPICSQVLSPVQLAILLSVIGIPSSVEDVNGQGAVTYITDTNAYTDLSATKVQLLADTVFATFTRTGATGSLTGLTLPAGLVLYGAVTAITLTSGAVAAYE